MKAKRERGATGLEYGGMIVAVALVVGLVAAAIVQGDVGPKVTAAICRIFGGDCANGEASKEPIDTKLPQCEVSSTAFKGTAEVTAFSVNLGGNGTMTLKKVMTSDGETKWVVEQAGGVKLGGHAALGADGKFGLGAGKSANLKAALKAGGGVSYDFTSEQAAKQFMQDAAKESLKYGVAGTTRIAAPATKWVLDKVTGGPLKYPDISEFYIEGGLEVSGDLKAAAGLDASLSESGSGVLGTKVKPGKSPKDTEYTVYVKGTKELSGALGLAGRGVDVGSAAEVVVGVTYKDGKAVRASIDAAGTLDASRVRGGKLPEKNIFGQPGKGNIGASVTGTIKGKVSLGLDLTNAQNRDALADVLQSTGMPILPDSGTPGYQNPAEAVVTLSDRFTKGGPREGATLTVQKFEGATGEYKFGFQGGKILAFGGGGSVSMTELNATDAAYYDPDVGGMAQWRRCSGDG